MQTELINKIKIAMGGRTQKDFADIAKISSYNLSRILTGKNQSNVGKSTLKRIAAASEGRISEMELLVAAGYADATKFVFNDDTIESMAKRVTEMISNSFEEALYNVVPSVKILVTQVIYKVGFVVGEYVVNNEIIQEAKCDTFVAPHNAECEVFMRLHVRTNEYEIIIPYKLYYVGTANGRIVPLHYDNSLFGLLGGLNSTEPRHPDAEEKFLEFANKDDFVIMDCPHVYFWNKVEKM